MCFALACEIGAGLREPRPLSKGCSGVWSVEKLFLWANKCFISLSEVEALQHFGWEHLPAEHLMPGSESCYKAERIQVLVPPTP